MAFRNQEEKPFKKKDDPYGFKPVYKAAPTFGFKENVEGIGFTVSDIAEHDKIVKQ